MSSIFKTSLLITILFGFPFFISGQIALKLNVESGAYLELNSNSEDRISSIHKIFGNITYNFKEANKAASLSLKVRPQILKNDFHSIKFGFDGSYFQNFNKLSLKSNISFYQNNLNAVLINPFYNTFLFVNQLEFEVANDFTFDTKLGYSYQEISVSNKVNSDFFFLRVLINKNIDNYSYLGIGIYTQKFATESEFNYDSRRLASSGWKYGPDIKIHYMRKFLFNAEYRFLIHNSNSTLYPSYEHNINLLSGTVVNNDLSIFLLVEFNFIRTKLKNEIGEKNPIYFFPTQNENELYVKTAYKLKKNFSIYAKLGYFRENLYLVDYKLDGLNLLLGIQITNL